MDSVEDIYELTPIQQGILFHSLFTPGHGLYFVQSGLVLRGRLDGEAFERAWQRVIERHPVLRSSFHWSDLDKSLQVVHRSAPLPLEWHDWRADAPAEQRARLDSLLQADRDRGFDLLQPPLMRLTLIRTGDEETQLVFSFHHLLLDGWSSFLVLQECASFYEAFRQGRELNLPRPRPYRDYILWLQQQDLSKAETFWREKLRGFTTATPLPSGRNRAESSDEGYDEMQVNLTPRLTAALQSLAREHQITFNTLLQGAWALLLSLHSGEGDVVFGTTVSGRPGELAGSETMVGLFINTLPVRIRISPETPLASWLKEIQSQQAEMRQYEYSPLVQVHEWSDVARGRPLFESLFVFENYRADVLIRERFRSLRAEKTHSFERANYPLSLIAVPGTELHLLAVYDRSRFDKAAVARLLAQFETILDSMLANRRGHLSDISLLTEVERRKVLVEWNETQADYPADLCIHQLFERRVEATPDVPAVIFEEQQLTYRQLNERANRLAHYLRARGVRPEVLVGVLMERSTEMLVSILAILKAGGSYVPLDPSYPKERLAFMLEDARVSVLLTQQRLLKEIPEHAAQLVAVDAEREALARESEENPHVEVLPENIAYVIYTSGSTGTPKGVLVTHRGVSNMSEAQLRTFRLTPGERVLQFASINFDASVFEMVMALRSGATLCMGTPESLLPGPTLLQFLREKSVTFVTLTPSTLAALPVEPVESLRTITVAGEACSAELVSNWGSQRRFFNLYGPTEATIWVTTAGEIAEGETPPIGRPVSNLQVFLLDRNLQPVPVGMPGELHIGGVGLARGYLGRPGLTAEKFIPHPFSHEPGARLYKTGDLAAYRPDGQIEFLGRNDYQIKIRGFRVELEEIEAVLRHHAAVRDCVVRARAAT
ncbi:MAG TPA: amino acid adenylation domain-containing protein, partial [Pyrinomonadaceae bacterium]|nr:amino acid adenylation domain-containing protein [Pyrinomonadaceae bacterium]